MEKKAERFQLLSDRSAIRPGLKRMSALSTQGFQQEAAVYGALTSMDHAFEHFQKKPDRSPIEKQLKTLCFFC